MCNQELLQIFYCAFCGEEYNNKINLQKHIGDDHSDENQCPEEVLRCPLCEAVFYHLDAYEVHLTFHSSEDMYSDDNKIIGEVIEFSLETIPPMVEKVEQCEPQEDTEDNIDAVGIDQFLQMALDQSIDNDNPESDQDLKSKSKKHKKHKKSKKSAITLDEFLSMNQDVFGEGLDFQGVEEIPTRVVNKQLKVQKAANMKQSKAELDKLKKQGITVKKKSKRAPSIIQGIKVRNKIPIGKPIKVLQKKGVNAPKSSQMTQLKSISTSDEVLSKLLNQSNNQIKIVKKTQDPQVKPVVKSNTDTNKAAENIEVECDIFLKSSETEPEETESIEVTKTMLEQHDNLNENKIIDSNISDTDKNNEILDQSLNKNDISENPEEIDINKNTHTEPIDVLKKVSEHVTIKSLNNSANLAKVDKESDCAIDSNVGIDSSLNKVSSQTERTNESLKAIQHLSHLTIKTNNKIEKPIISQPLNQNAKQKKSDNVSIDRSENTVTLKSTEIKHISGKQIVNNNKQMSAFKNLNKHITVKNMPKSQAIHEESFNTDGEDDFNDELQGFQSITKSNEQTEQLKIPEKRSAPIPLQMAERKVIKTIKTEPKDSNPLLKNLSNVTVNAKNSKNIQMKQPTQQKVIRSPPQSVTLKSTTTDDIEVFHIEDSDSDDASQGSTQNSTNNAPIKTQTDVIKDNKSDVLKNLGKHIIVKPLNQKPTQSVQSTKISENKTQKITQRISHKEETIRKEQCERQVNEKNSALKQALKTLGKNITVKSGNSSPSVKSQGHDTQDSDAHVDSDFDSDNERVKITELPENENMSDDDINKTDVTKKVIVQHPDDSNSDMDHCENEFDDQFTDDESQIPANIVRKPQMNTFSNTQSMKSVKQLSKDITIRSLNENKQCEKATSSRDVSDASHNSNSLKFSQSIPKVNTESPPIKKVKYIGTVQPPVQKVATSSQFNTVKQEVTTKTVQTVIEEVTTTVTKTVRTVNTVQQIQNSNVTQGGPRLQTPQVVRPQMNRNLQGVVVRRPAASCVGTKIRNAIMPPRPTQPAVRPSNQLVPVRPRFSGPRTPLMNKVRPSPNQQRPLKMSPNAVISNKSHQEEKGPFSCFKKSKESLIPVSDVPSFSGDADSSMQFTSVAHMSKSHFTSTTKTIKGDSVMTSTQMKSEMSSQQQVSRLNNISGMKVVKTSQCKQAQVEKSEISASKRTTLAAIEKLQKQGLLVKKPRLDVEESEQDSWDDE